MKFLSNRTLVAIKARAQKLGLKRGKHTWASVGRYKPWRKNEINLLRKNWNKMSLTDLSKLFGYIVTEKALTVQAKKMGLPLYDKEKFKKPKRKKKSR